MNPGSNEPAAHANVPPRLQGRKVLLTGASGFIGSHLSRRLLEFGAEVHAISRAQHRSDARRLNWWQGDIGDMGFTRWLFQELEPDYVLHLASHVMGSPALDHVLPTFRGNLATTVNLLTAAAEYGCTRILLTGSLSEPEPEHGEAFPSCPYAAAKWASSMYARMFHALYGVPAVVARVFMVYGPAQRDQSKLIPYTTITMMQGGVPQITSGSRLVDWIYVADVVEGLVAAMTAQGIEGSTVELGSGSLVSIREIVERIEALVGAGVSASFGTLPDRPHEPVRMADTAGSLLKLGWRPVVTLEEGLARTVAWYREHLGDLESTPLPVPVAVART